MITVDPVTLGVTATALAVVFFTKLAEKAGEKTGDQSAAAVGKLVGWLRGRFSPDGDPDSTEALTRLEDVPDSPRLQDALAQAITGKAQEDPAFKAELEKLVNQAHDAGVDVRAITQTAVGNDNTQFADIHGSTITFGQPGKTDQSPRRDDTTPQGTDR